MMRPPLLSRSHTHPRGSRRRTIRLAALGASAAVAGLIQVGCTSSASTVLHAPVIRNCQKAELEACQEMTDGVVQYLDGHTVAGSRHLLDGGARNTDEGRERYALLLEQAQGLPGAGKYKRQLAEVVLVLNHADSAVQEEQPAPPGHIITAETDLDQARDGTVPAPSTTPDWCSSNFGDDAKCVMVMRGPLFVTDVVSVGLNCRGQFASVLRGGSVRAHIEGPFDLHGGRLLLTPADTLVFGQKSAPAAPPAQAPPPEAPSAKAPTGKAKPVATPPPSSAPPESQPKDDCPYYWSGYVPYRELE